MESNPAPTLSFEHRIILASLNGRPRNWSVHSSAKPKAQDMTRQRSPISQTSLGQGS